MNSNLSLETLSDEALMRRFGELVEQDRRRTAALLRHIEVIDRRKIWAKLGYPSMFALCVNRYHMSESTAGKRIGAARAARRFPILFSMIASGEIHLSGLHRLKAQLTTENHKKILQQAKHKTMREVEELVARLAPQPDVPTTLRALPRRRTAPDPVPLAPGRYKLQLTLGQSAHDKLRQLQDLLAHQIQNTDPAVIVELALDALLTEVQKRKIGSTDRPRSAKPTRRSGRRVRAIPVTFRREVWKRDQGRCTFEGEDGHRCNETRGLEFAHLKPWGQGGEHSVENLALRCRAHNALEADRDYGASTMAGKRARRAAEQPLVVRESVATLAWSTLASWPTRDPADALNQRQLGGQPNRHRLRKANARAGRECSPATLLGSEARPPLPADPVPPGGSRPLRHSVWCRLPCRGSARCG